MRRILIIGGTSPIAEAALMELAVQGAAILVVGRDGKALERIAANARIRSGAEVHWALFDLIEVSTHHDFLGEAVGRLGGLDGVLLAAGTLGEDPASLDPVVALQIFAANLTGAVSILSVCASYFITRGQGTIVAVTSVAGDRGRQSNFVYGAAKGGLNIWLQGLRNRLYTKGIRVVTVKPGFLDTAMTYGRSGIFASASPKTTGRVLAKAFESGPDEVYFPSFWCLIMFIIKHIPERIFKRLKL